MMNAVWISVILFCLVFFGGVVLMLGKFFYNQHKERKVQDRRKSFKVVK